MSRVMLNCPACHAGFRIELGACLVSTGDGPARLAFVCLSCRDLVERPIPPEAVRALTASGHPPMVAVRRVPHPESPPPGPPLTLDDLLDLHESLADNRFASECLGGDGRVAEVRHAVDG